MCEPDLRVSESLSFEGVNLEQAAVDVAPRTRGLLEHEARQDGLEERREVLAFGAEPCGVLHLLHLHGRTESRDEVHRTGRRGQRSSNLS